MSGNGAWGRALRFLLGAGILASLMPVAGTTAPGEVDDWKSEANARIEQLRKRNVEITVVNSDGATVSGATVEAVQLRHHFAFGSTINFNLVNNQTYRDFFFDHFEWAVFENQSKWHVNEKMRDFVNYDQADAMADLCEANGVPMRGHCLFWAKEQYTPPWARTLPPEELREEVDERIDDAVDHFRDTFLHWDINNEMLDGHFFKDRLGDDIRPHMFQRANEIDPDSLLFVNDYSIIAGSTSRTAAYVSQIENLQAQGAPIHAIGVQGHFWGDTVSPTTILARLDQLSVLGLPVWITEYDAVDADDVGRADKLENCYRASFSHPSVEGILMWGFWAGSHWRGADAAIVDEDWTLNAAGERYLALMDEWTTEETGVTDMDGRFGFRAFHGNYEVTVDPGSGPLLIESFQVPPGEGRARLLVPVDPGSCFAAEEVQELRLEHDGGDDTTLLKWEMAPWRSDIETVYDVLRSGDPSDFANDTTCLEGDDGADTMASDPETPPAGTAWYYLVRAEYECRTGDGPLGAGTDGVPRPGRTCR